MVKIRKNRNFFFFKILLCMSSFDHKEVIKFYAHVIKLLSFKNMDRQTDRVIPIYPRTLFSGYNHIFELYILNDFVRSLYFTPCSGPLFDWLNFKGCKDSTSSRSYAYHDTWPKIRYLSRYQILFKMSLILLCVFICVLSFYVFDEIVLLFSIVRIKFSHMFANFWFV